MRVFLFHFFETVEVELSDEALEFGVSEEFGKNFCFNFFLSKISIRVPLSSQAIMSVLAGSYNKRECY